METDQNVNNQDLDQNASEMSQDPSNDNVGGFGQQETVEENTGPTIIDTSGSGKTGQNKCPKCGATDVVFSIKTGLLTCGFCRHQFQPEAEVGMEKDIWKLEGEVIGSSAAVNVDKESGKESDLITLKCESCGAEVVINSAETTQARCHWCRNVLSLGSQVANGAVPDAILPFSVPKEKAQSLMKKFADSRRFFALSAFKREFNVDNIIGVYMPYMIVDVNAHMKMKGVGEHLLRSYTVKHGKSETKYYDFEVYDVGREFDMAVKGLTIEGSSSKRDKKDKKKTNNIINSIMPFDTENCVRFNANYMSGGFTSEKRDTNIDELREPVKVQVKDIGRISINDTLKYYDRGVRWDNEQLDVKGAQWQTAYLPVWLYSYYQKGNGMLHYMAVNARTEETMGSIPINKVKLFFVSLIVEIFAAITAILVEPFFVSENDDEESCPVHMLLYLAGFIFYWLKYSRYRNQGARHNHESETPLERKNEEGYDNHVETVRRSTRSSLSDANSTKVYG